MIFVTVGTHEQQFDRLLKYIDWLKEKESITEKVIMQIGYSTYEPKFCQWQNLFSFSEMSTLIKKADIVITHGGPSSFIMPLQIGKIPIVVPRQKRYGEHVNNHQVDFCREVAIRYKNIIEVEEINQLEKTLANYNKIVARMEISQNSNNDKFCREFSNIVDEIFKKETED